MTSQQEWVDISPSSPPIEILDIMTITYSTVLLHKRQWGGGDGSGRSVSASCCSFSRSRVATISKKKMG